ncbi:16778_t:CDS:2, partial [Dentiscutata heterogama]
KVKVLRNSEKFGLKVCCALCEKIISVDRMVLLICLRKCLVGGIGYGGGGFIEGVRDLESLENVV